MTKELKKCPFCGSRNVELYMDNFHLWRSHVRCRQCGIEGPFSYYGAVAVRKWNKRNY